MNTHTTYRVYSGLLIGAMMGGLLLTGPNTAAAQEVDASAIRAQQTLGKQALASGDYNSALEAFEEALVWAEPIGDSELVASLRFNLGLTHQQRNSAENDLDLAEAYYRRMLALEESGAARNNLAQLYIQTDRLDEAAEQYVLAIEANDDRQAFYAQNFATFLRQQGRLSEAIRYYTLALATQPDNTALHDALTATYLAEDRDDRSDLADYLWRLVGSGQEVRALETALTALLTTALSQENKRDLLTCAVVALSKQTYEPDTFEETDIGAQFRELAATDEDIGRGAAAILRLHDAEEILRLAETTDRSEWPGWWTEDNNWSLSEDPPPGRVWPLEGFRMLVRAVGSWYQQRDATAVAEAYFAFSALINDIETDPEALLQLAELHFAEGDPDRVEALMNRYGEWLFQGKADAIRASRWKKTFDYHRTLGIMYGLIGQWGNSGNPASAIFQLEHARIDLGRYNENIRDPERTPPLRFEPRLVNLLADGYEQTGNADRANSIRLQAAEEYAEQGDQGSLEKVLEPLDGKPLPRVLQQRYNRLRAQTNSISLTGQVIGARRGNPIPEAMIIVRGIIKTTTDDHGAFRIRARLGDTLQVKKRGYQDRAAIIRGDSLTLPLSLIPQQDTRPDSSLLTITGRVTTAQGTPLADVLITVKGTATTTRTQRTGTYRIRVRSGAVLIFSHERFRPKEVSLRSERVVNVTF